MASVDIVKAISKLGEDYRNRSEGEQDAFMDCVMENLLKKGEQDGFRMFMVFSIGIVVVGCERIGSYFQARIPFDERLALLNWCKVKKLDKKSDNPEYWETFKSLLIGDAEAHVKPRPRKKSPPKQRQTAQA